MFKCEYETDRLTIGSLENNKTEWENISIMLTAPVTHSLPESWQGVYTAERTQNWLNDCATSAIYVLSVKLKVHPHNLVGLVILFPIPHLDMTSVDIRLGYLLAEQSWGQGYASEVVKGILDWCKERNVTGTGSGVTVKRLLGGVALDNPASKRVLLKNGFQQIEGDGAPEEEVFEIEL